MLYGFWYTAVCFQICLLLFSYQHNMDPYLRIGPFKIEELNKEPIILMFHDFLPNVETNEIISRASSKLFMSTTGFAGEASQNMQLRLVSKRCLTFKNNYRSLNITFWFLLYLHSCSSSSNKLKTKVVLLYFDTMPKCDFGT